MSYFSRLSVEIKERDYQRAHSHLCTAHTLRHGLAIANRGNPFWSQRDAMQALALFHNNQRSA